MSTYLLIAFGGRLKSADLVCKECNKTTGHLYDAEFAKIGNYFASKYNIKRDRGAVPVFGATELITGRPIKVEPGLKTLYVHPVSGYNDEMIFVEHHDKKRVIEEFKRLAKQLGDDDIDPANIFFEDQDSKPQMKINFLFDESIEPALLLRSVCKTIINLYLYKTGDYNNCFPLVEFLRKGIENRFCWFLDIDISKAAHHGAPYHTMIIKAEKKNMML